METSQIKLVRYRNAKAYRLTGLITLLLGVLSFLASLWVAPPTAALTTVPTKMNFQGRLTDSAGNVKPNGTYNMKLRVYDASSGGTLKFSEERLVSAGTGVTVTNGLFSIRFNEGSNKTGTFDASIFASGALYLEVEVPTPGTATSSSPTWTEGPMTPRNQMATSAYAFNAETLDGIDSDELAKLSSSNSFTAANSINVSAASAFQVKVGTANVLNVNTSSAQVTVGQADTSGILLVLDTKTDAGDPTGVAGGMYYNSNLGKLRCYQTTWVDCVAAGGSATLQNVYDNSTSPATITTTAAKGIAITAAAAPTTDMLTISNASQPTTTAGVSGIQVSYAGGAAAVEGSGIRVDYTPGGTTGGTWNGLRVVANATGAAAGVSATGLKLEGPTLAGSGTDTALAIGTGWDIGVDIQAGGIQLSSEQDPATPAAGKLRLYAKDIAGRILPKWIGPSGVDTPIQANLGFNRVSLMMPSGGTTLTTFINGYGSLFTNVGTGANPTPTSTNLLTSTRRATFSTGTTAGALASHRQSVQQVWRGNAAGMGGFFYTIRFGTSALVSGNRAFVGLSDSVAAPTNVDPTTSATIGKIGVAIAANTGNWKFVTNTAGTAPTVTDLGANLPVNSTDLYELVLFSAPNGSSVGYRLKNLSTGNSASGSPATNLPANTSFLAPQFWITNNATAAAAIIDFGGWYLESDQ